jgi:hypothetical protein
VPARSFSGLERRATGRRLLAKFGMRRGIRNGVSATWT